MFSIVSRCIECGAKSSPCDFSAIPGTPHHALLNSNDVPLESDAAIVKSTISRTDQHLAWLDREIARLSEQLKQLEEERLRWSSYQAKNRGILSPLRRVPTELLCEIFGWTLTSARESESQLARHPGFCETDSPWVLTHVSRTWREVSVSSPSLWSIVAVNFPNLDLSSSYPLAMIETHVARAQNLRVIFRGSDAHHAPNQIEIFRYLAKHASRWQELRIDLAGSLYPLLDSLRGCVPLLCRVWIRCPGHIPSPEAQSFDFLNTASSLVDTAFYNPPSDFSFHPPSHLTRYELEATLTIHRDLVALAPHLVEAHVYVTDNEESWPRSHEIIGLSLLRRLYVSNGGFLQYIRAPALEELGLHISTASRLHLESFLMRSSCTLQCLCLPDCADFSPYDFNVQETLAVLNNISSLVEFRVNISHSAHQVNVLLAGLAVSDARTRVVAPQLSCISFTPEPWLLIPFDYGAYTKMIKSRWDSPECALTRTELCTSADPGLAPFGSLQLLRENGLQFMLRTGSEATRITSRWMCTYTFDSY
ncbi:hypothetical protein MSAN_00751800 [Mycena sanguinolenta]|uniref:F-box domain-containing protein n=1 Tax=Mycena sanguinolenta TaxID=230812 RepID=A0A8H6Z1Z6_9AGAR|nr:hypothetical protein MSAN_00751800 [Mycena sanguinolenta]